MKHHIQYAASLIMLSCIPTACSHEPAPDERSSSMSKKTPIDDRVAFTASFPKRFALNDSWPMTVTVRNTGKERLTISLRRGDEIDVLVEARDVDGNRLERTDFGNRHLPGQYIEGALIDSVISAILKHLEPGESHSWSIELDKCFVFAPGDYILEMSLPVEPIDTFILKTRISVLPAAK